MPKFGKINTMESNETSVNIKRKLDALEAASGILKELTSEQIKIFDEAIKRKPFLTK